MKITLKQGFITLFVCASLNSYSQDNYTDNKSINSLLSKKREYNKYNGSGFRIQLYNGVETTARNIKANYEKEYYGEYTKLDYEAPDWKVQVGNYRSRLEADRALNRIREKFSGAIIIEK